MVTPRRNIEQSVGRILRAKTDIEPMIIDLVDQLEKDLENGSRKVEKWANNIGVKTINIEFDKEEIDILNNSNFLRKVICLK